MAGGHPKFRHLNRSSAHRQALLRNLVTSLFTHETIRTTWPKAKEAQRLAERLITLGKRNTEASRRVAQTIFYVRVPCMPHLVPFFSPILLPFYQLLFRSIRVECDRHVEWSISKANMRICPSMQTPHALLPKLFGELRRRYAERPGGYTRVLRVEPAKADAAPSAVLELVDGPRDMRFAMTARTLARLRALERDKDEAAQADGGDSGRQGEGHARSRGWNDITATNVKKVTRYRQGGEQALEKLVRQFERLGVARASKDGDSAG